MLKKNYLKVGVIGVGGRRKDLLVVGRIRKKENIFEK